MCTGAWGPALERLLGRVEKSRTDCSALLGPASCTGQGGCNRAEKDPGGVMVKAMGD